MTDPELKKQWKLEKRARISFKLVSQWISR